MNLIPFVMIIMVVFSLFSSSHIRTAFTQTKEKHLYCTYFKGLREARNKKLKSFRADYKTSSSRTHPKPVTVYFREERIGWEKGKLNLSSLLSEATYRKILHDLAATYINMLYKNAKFFPKDENFAHKLISLLIKTYKKNPQLAFYEIHFKDKNIQAIFYKMIRGTHSYCLNPNKGYPPFSAFFTFELESRHPINFHYANTTLLTAMFGTKFVQKIRSEEFIELAKITSRCKSPLNAKKFQAMLNEAFIPNSHELYLLIDFNYTKSLKIPGKFHDEKTNLTVLAP